MQTVKSIEVAYSALICFLKKVTTYNKHLIILSHLSAITSTSILVDGVEYQGCEYKYLEIVFMLCAIASTKYYISGKFLDIFGHSHQWTISKSPFFMIGMNTDCVHPSLLQPWSSLPNFSAYFV